MFEDFWNKLKKMGTDKDDEVIDITFDNEREEEKPQVEEEKIKLIYTLGGTKKDTLFKVIIPSSVPIIVSNMKVNIGLALVGVIIGEFLAARQGLGYLIIYGSQVFQLDLLIMSIIILCIIAVGLYQTIQFFEKRYHKIN